MPNCVQVATVTTQVSALLDHVFLRKDLSKNTDVKNVIRTLYFSDHDAVLLEVLFKINASNMLHRYNSQ